MSYYNPYEQYQQDHYDPSANVGTTQEAKGATFGSMAGTMVRDMVIYSVAASVTGALSKFVGKGLQKGVQKLAPNSFLAKKWSAVPKANASLGKLAKEILPNEERRKLAKAAMPFKQALHKRNRYLSNLGKRDPLRAKAETISSAFKDPITSASVLGNFVLKGVLPGSAVSYGIDNLLGYNQQRGLENKAWYNLPGHAVNYMKWLPYEIAGVGMFRALGPIAKSIQGGAGIALKNSPLPNFMNKVIENNKGLFRAKTEIHESLYKKDIIADPTNKMDAGFLERSIIKMKGAQGTFVQQVLENTRTYVKGGFSRDVGKGPTGLQGTKHPANFMKRTIETFREINAKRKEFAAVDKMMDANNVPGISLIRGFDELSRAKFNTAGMPDPGGFGGDQLLGALAAANRDVKPNNFFAQVMGFSPTSVKDVISTDVLQSISANTRKYFPETPKHAQFMQQLESSFIGPHMYTNKSGLALDLEYMSPINALKRVGKGLLNLNLALAVGLPPMGRHLTLSAVTGAHTLLSGKVKAATFTKSTTGLGLVVDNSSGKAQTLKELAGRDLDEPIVSLIGRKFYAFDGFQVKQLDTGNSYLKLSHPSLGGAMGEFKANSVKKLLYDNKEMYAAEQLGKVGSADPSVTNPFIYLAKKLDWEAPMWFQHTLNKVRRTLQPKKLLNNGKVVDYHQQLYVEAARGLLGKDIDYDKLHFHVSTLKELMTHADQEVSNIGKRPSALHELAAASRKYSFRTMQSDLDVVYSDVQLTKVIQQMSGPEQSGQDGGRLFAQMMKDPTTKAAYQYMLEQPTSARNHIISSRIGRLSDYKVTDNLRVSYLMNNFDWHPKDGPHPMVSISSEMFKKGVITKNERNALRLSASIRTMFSDEKLMGNFVLGHDSGVRDAVKKAVITAKEYHRSILTDTIDYISSTDLRMPSLAPNIESHKIASRLMWESKALQSKFFDTNDSSPYVAFGYKGTGMEGAIGTGANILSFGAERFTNLIKDITGFKKDYAKFGPGVRGTFKYLTTRGLQIAAAGTAFKAADAFLAGTPLFDQTMFDDGLTGFMADVGAKLHLMSAKVRDVTGITSTAKYLEGLLPGFTTTAPGMLIGSALNFKGGMVKAMGGALKGALVNRILSPYMPDMTKDFEQLSQEYSGESNVPIINGQSWLLGTTPWQGNRVVGWKPNWYVETKSRWKASDSLYGSEARKLLHEPIFPLGFSIGDLVDPYYMERKHYFSRPYPETATLGEETPLGLGGLIGNTIGRVIKRKRVMHRDFLEGSDMQGSGPADPSISAPSLKSELLRMRIGTFSPRKFSRRSAFEGTMVYSGTANSAQVMADKYLGDFESALGLVGFGMGTIRTGLAGQNVVLPTLESAGKISSMSRSYYNMNLGGLGIFTEPIRRFTQKPEWSRYGVNPIPNMLPNWLPSRYLKGDPYTKVISGELRLPGRAYEMTHPNIRMSMPARASMLGGYKDEIVKYFTGTMDPLSKQEYDIMDEGTEFHEDIQNWLKAENLLIQAEAFIIDVKNNVSGHVDAIIKDGVGGGGRRALEIKSINKKGFAGLQGPKYKHVSQLNFYLSKLGLSSGTFLYINRDNPAEFKTYDIEFDRYKLTKDMNKLHDARRVAGDMIARGKTGAGAGYAYSWADRMLILSDLAPYSQEYKEAKNVVMQQIKSNTADDDIVNKFTRAEKQRTAVIRKYELYPLRFKDRVFNPDSEANIQSLNDNIKAADQYSLPERAVGAIWETITNQNTFLVNKFLAFKDPLEHYKQYQLYGKEYTPWTDPMGSFVSPMLRSIAGAEGPIEGAITAGLGLPYLLGGAAGGAYGALAGGLYGLAHSVVSNTTGSAYIPQRMQKAREINDYFDTLKYNRNVRMASLSEGLDRDKYTGQSRETLFNLVREGGSYTDFFRGVYHTEKPYIESWLKENDPQRREDILRFAPQRLGQALKSYWHNDDDDFTLLQGDKDISADMASGRRVMPYSMQQLDPSVMLEDIKLKTINKAGLNAHDFGLGWQEQMVRVQNDLNRIDEVNLNAQPISPEILDPSVVKSAIYMILNKMGVKGRVSLYINNHTESTNFAHITIQRDNTQSLLNSLSIRDKWIK